MRTAIWAAVLLLAAGAAPAQRHRPEINTETPEGALLQLIGQEQDETKKLALMEEFIGKHPNHNGAGWVYEQMLPAYTKANQHDKAMGAGEKLLALDPEDCVSAHAALKVAEAKKDPDAVLKWAVTTSEAARKTVKSKKPEDESEVDNWKRKVDFAQQVEKYTAYSIYATVLQLPDPAKKVQLSAALIQRYPDSEYVGMVEPAYFLAARQMNDTAKAAQIAERALAAGRVNEDMLLVAADHYYRQKNADKVHELAGKLVEMMKTKPAPQGVSAEDWEKKRRLSVGLGLWMSGVTAAAQGKFADADGKLREALPLISDNKALQAEALFHLGVANFRLGDKVEDSQRIIDAVRFSEQCAAIPGPFQAAAKKNVAGIRAKYHVK